MLESIARFFLNPIGVPSGVSIGHNRPICVQCNALASKFSWLVLNKLTTLCRCELVDKKFVLSMFWLTPCLPPGQLPVAMALFILPVNSLSLIIILMLWNFPLLTSLWKLYIISLTKILKFIVNKSDNKSPLSLILLFI